jgi:hypothetical protein
MARHVFFDNSNIFGGALNTAEVIEPGALSWSVRLYYPNLFSVIEGHEPVGSRIFVGSVAAGHDSVWQIVRDLGYATNVLVRAEKSDGRLGEQAVDEILHLKMANAILDHTAPQTLVIASGDGRLSNYGTSFPGQAERALKAGWNVEVWSWSSTLTGGYRRLSAAFPGRVLVRMLDPFYFQTTFVKAGHYQVDRSTIQVAGRPAARLRPAHAAA